MHKTEAKKYLEDVIKVWTNSDVKLLEKYYATDFQGNLFGNKIIYADLVKRINYIKQHHTQAKQEIMDVIAEDNKISARFHYYAVDDIEGIVDGEIIGIYHLNQDKKIKQAWACSFQSINYSLK